MLYYRTQLKGFFWGKVNGKSGEGRGETGLWAQEWQKRREQRGGREKEVQRKGEMGGGQSPLKGEHSECAQKVLLVATADDIFSKEGQARTDA